MAAFLLRVELHNINMLASLSVYEKLHEVLSNAGVRRSVVSGDGRIAMLPTGTYYVEGTASEPTFVRDHLVKLLDPMGHKYELIVTRVESWASQNLSIIATRI